MSMRDCAGVEDFNRRHSGDLHGQAQFLTSVEEDVRVEHQKLLTYEDPRISATARESPRAVLYAETNTEFRV